MSTPNNALPVGTIIKSNTQSYRIERVLGAGGFGITYEATTTVRFGNIPTKISVAIKEHFLGKLCERDNTTSSVVYSNPVKDEVENSRKDFIAEATRLQRVGVSHHNIVKVNEVFLANNTAYYVMEFLDGESLRSYVKRKGGIAEDEIVKLLKPVSDAVDYLHRNNMTHLDIKPDNIMITTDENGLARPVLIDFGLSKHYDSNGTPTSTINTLGCSDGYAPIEQYAGITKFTPRADIYALGATMMYCVTARDPKKSTEITPADIKAATASLSDKMAQTIATAMSANRHERPDSINFAGGDVPPVVPPGKVKKEKDKNITIGLNQPKKPSDGNPWLMLCGGYGTIAARVFGVITLLYVVLMIFGSIFIAMDAPCDWMDILFCLLTPVFFSIYMIAALFRIFNHKMPIAIPAATFGVWFISLMTVMEAFDDGVILISIVSIVMMALLLSTYFLKGKIQRILSIIAFALSLNWLGLSCMALTSLVNTNAYLNHGIYGDDMDSYPIEVAVEEIDTAPAADVYEDYNDYYYNDSIAYAE